MHHKLSSLAVLISCLFCTQISASYPSIRDVKNHLRSQFSGEKRFHELGVADVANATLFLMLEKVAHQKGLTLWSNFAPDDRDNVLEFVMVDIGGQIANVFHVSPYNTSKALQKAEDFLDKVGNIGGAKRFIFAPALAKPSHFFDSKIAADDLYSADEGH